MCFRGKDIYLKPAHLLPPELRRFMPFAGGADVKKDYSGSDGTVNGKYGRPMSESVYAAQRFAGAGGWPPAQESRSAPFQHHQAAAYSSHKVRRGY